MGFTEIATVEKEKSSKRLKKRKKKPLPEGFISFAQDIAKSLPSAENNIENVQRQGKKAKSKEALVYVLIIFHKNYILTLPLK